jgi:hypothetical protein
MSRSASVWKSPPCAERKSRARKLLCAVKCVIGSKLRGEGGAVQVRRRHGGRSEAPVDDVRRCSNKTCGARSQNSRQDDVKVHVRVFHATLKRIGCGISPHTMPERESRRSRKSPGPRLNLADCSIHCVNSTGERLLILIVFLEGRIVFSIVALITGHLKQTLEVHTHGVIDDARRPPVP